MKVIEGNSKLKLAKSAGYCARITLTDSLQINRGKSLAHSLAGRHKRLKVINVPIVAARTDQVGSLSMPLEIN